MERKAAQKFDAENLAPDAVMNAKIKIDRQVYEVPAGKFITSTELLRMAPNRFADEYAPIDRRRIYKVKGEALLFAAASHFCENSDPKTLRDFPMFWRPEFVFSYPDTGDEFETFPICDGQDIQ